MLCFSDTTFLKNERQLTTFKDKIQKHLEKNHEKKSEDKLLKKAKTEKTLETVKSERIKDITEQMNFLFSKGKSAAELFSNILLGKANIATGDIKSKSIKNLKLNIGRNLDVKLQNAEILD